MGNTLKQILSLNRTKIYEVVFGLLMMTQYIIVHENYDSAYAKINSLHTEVHFLFKKLT